MSSSSSDLSSVWVSLWLSRPSCQQMKWIFLTAFISCFCFFQFSRLLIATNAVVDHAKTTESLAIALMTKQMIKGNYHADSPNRRKQQQDIDRNKGKDGKDPKHASSSIVPMSRTTKTTNDNYSCAINLFGLPRAFRSLVLPSLERNVIPYNLHCDYFVHYYNITHEGEGRAGSGGTIHPKDILLLTEAVHKVNPHAVVQYRAESDTEFLQRNARVLEQVSQAPYKPDEFNVPTTWNIIRMWNSIQSAWDFMNEYHNYSSSTTTTTTTNKKPPYRRVAFLRSDVLYINPINIWQIPLSSTEAATARFKEQKATSSSSSSSSTLLLEVVDEENRVAVVPSFGTWPVNDRYISGPYEAVQIWAAQRFEFMEDYVKRVLKRKADLKGSGIHDEKFLAYYIFPKIKQTSLSGATSSTRKTVTTTTTTRWKAKSTTTLRSSSRYEIRPHESLCFVRVRADLSIWVDDCEQSVLPVLESRVKRERRQLEWFTQKYQRDHLILHREGPSTPPNIVVNYSAVVEYALYPQTCRPIQPILYRNGNDPERFFLQCHANSTDTIVVTRNPPPPPAVSNPP